MNVHVLLSLLNDLGKSDKAEHFIAFLQQV